MMTFGQLISALLTFLAIVMSLIGWIWARVNSLKRECIGSDMCNLKHGDLKERLDKGDNKFLLLDKKLDALSENLTEVKTIVKMIAEK